MVETRRIPNPTPELEFYTGSPENFRGEGPGFYPKRFVEPTKRVNAFLDIIDSSYDNRKLKKGLFDLVMYNCYGNIFPPVNSAGDFIGVVNEKVQKTEIKRKKYRNCVSLAIVKGQLAVVGGFVDIDEDPHTTAVRKQEKNQI